MPDSEGKVSAFFTRQQGKEHAGEAPDIYQPTRSPENSLSEEQHGGNSPHDPVTSQQVSPSTHGDYSSRWSLGGDTEPKNITNSATHFRVYSDNFPISGGWAFEHLPGLTLFSHWGKISFTTFIPNCALWQYLDEVLPLFTFHVFKEELPRPPTHTYQVNIPSSFSLSSYNTS